MPSAIDNSSLKEILRSMVERADRAPEQKIDVCLPRGLWISVTQMNETPGYRLELSRSGVYPSLQEWATVCAHWPWKIKVNFNPNKSGPAPETPGTRYLFAFLDPRPVEVPDAD